MNSWLWLRLRFRRIFGGVDTYPHGQVFTLVGVRRLSGKLVLLSERIMTSVEPSGSDKRSLKG